MGTEKGCDCEGNGEADFRKTFCKMVSILKFFHYVETSALIKRKKEKKISPSAS